MIELRNLQAGYGKLIILHEINLQLKADRFTAILGPNGSGKSTLLKSIFGQVRIFEGSIHLQGHDLTGMQTELVGRHGIAYVPQRQNVFTSMTVRENLLLAVRQLSKVDSHTALEQAYELFPILVKRERQRAGQLSGGERQMLAMALGWMSNPRVMLLDEPTAGLAPVVATELFRTLQQLKEKGITLVVVEQNARRILQWCDEVIVLREGQIVYQGDADECRADEDILKRYLGVSMGKIEAKS